MIRHAETWDAEMCRDKHRSLMIVNGVFLSALGLLTVSLGWGFITQRDVTARAELAVQRTDVEAAKVGEFRDFLKQDLAGINTRLTKLGETQDKINLSMQRMIIIHEKDHVTP